MNLAEIYGKQDVEKSIRIVESDISLISEYERYEYHSLINNV